MKILKKFAHSSKKVLIVDDEPDIRFLLSELVLKTQSDAEITEAENGHQALSLFLENGFDLMITDLRMPLVDGDSLIHSLTHLRNGNRPKHLLVISAYINNVEEVKVGDISVTKMPKPVDREILNDYLKKYL